MRLARYLATALTLAGYAWLGIAPPAAASTTSPMTSKERTVRTLRAEVRHNRTQTWHYQDAAHVPRTQTRYMEEHTSSQPFLHWIRRLWRRRRDVAKQQASRARAPAAVGTVPQIICRVFGSACQEAIAVARCESGFSIHAINGQYYGIFQMGSSERARYATLGYSTAYAQVVAAHNYYVAAGWGPWTCA